MKLNNFFKLIISLLVSGLSGFIAWFFIGPGFSNWHLVWLKFVLDPSNLVFVIVWILLYILLGIAAFLIWKRREQTQKVRAALLIFLFQLIANSFWLIIFFGTHNFSLAFLEVVSLWCAALATILIFYEIFPRAAYLLIPYIIWITFSAYANYTVWQNPSLSQRTVQISSTKSVVVRPTLANPASVNCLKEGGALVNKKDGVGGEYSLCDFGSGQACEEWALFRGNCPQGGIKTTGFDTEAQKYCAWLGGQTLAVPQALCTFKDGSKCSVINLYHEKCTPGENK